jgi:hypothetical protein
MKKSKKWKVEFLIVDTPQNGDYYLYSKDSIIDKILNYFPALNVDVEDIKVKKL